MTSKRFSIASWWNGRWGVEVWQQLPFHQTAPRWSEPFNNYSITFTASDLPGPRAIPPDNTQFAEVELSKRLQRVIPSYGYWNMQFLTTEKAYVKFNFTIPRGSSIGFYARRNALPTHTQYDFKEILSGFNTRTARAAYQPTIHRDVTRFMEAGFWFISLYNDDGHNQEVTFYASIAGEMMRNCPNGCNGNGNCIGGHCQCNAGFGGDSCNESKFYIFVFLETHF